MLIAEYLSNRELNCFLRVNCRTYQALIDTLCRRNIEQQGSSALSAAVQNNHVEVVCRLVRLKADVNTASVIRRLPWPFLQSVGRDRLIIPCPYQQLEARKETPLLIAVATNNLRVVNILLDAGARVQPHYQLTDETPLELAIKNGNIPIVRVLINASGDINASVKSHWTAVGIASYSKQVEILKYLLEKGATPTIPCEVFDHLLSVEHPPYERRRRPLNGHEARSGNSNRTVYRYRLDDTPIEILRLLMHYGLRTTEQQRQQGRAHYDPRVRYIFFVYDPASNIRTPPKKHFAVMFGLIPRSVPSTMNSEMQLNHEMIFPKAEEDLAPHIDTLCIGTYDPWNFFGERYFAPLEMSPTPSEPSASNDGKKSEKEEWPDLRLHFPIHFPQEKTFLGVSAWYKGEGCR